MTQEDLRTNLRAEAESLGASLPPLLAEAELLASTIMLGEHGRRRMYKASFSGALKTLLDVLPERALNHKVVLPIATGGSSAHMLAVDYALKPVLAALKAQEMLHAIFADDGQIAYGENGAAAQLAPALEQRLDDALQHFQQALARRPAPIDPGVLNDRLINARWSI